MIKEQFPTAYDVEQTLTFYTSSYNSLKQFTQSLGLFAIGRSKRDIADFAINILFEHKDYVTFRKIAQGGEPAISISGFTLRHRLHELPKEILIQDIIGLKNEIDQERDNLLKKGAPIPRLSTPTQHDDGLISVDFEYQRVIPGRVELMHRVKSKISFTLKKVGPAQWRLLCYPQANQDVKQVESLFKKMGGGTYETYTISLESFTPKKRIQFFDTLLQCYAEGKEWKFEQVTQITIQSSGNLDHESILIDEESLELADLVLVDDEEVDRKDLISITQAILEGKNLRTNSFVQDCEKQGFYFLSMTLELNNTKTPEVIQVRIRFKLSPKMFEVVLVSMAERDEMGEQSIIFLEKRQYEILNEFWNASHEIWQEIEADSPKQFKEQLSFADHLESQTQVV